MKNHAQISITVLVLLLAVLPTSESLGEGPPSANESTRRAIGYLKVAGESWIDHRGCVSCHQIPSLLWSYQASRRLGIDGIDDDLKRWQEWSTEVVNFVKPNQKDDVDVAATLSANIDTMVGLLLAIPPADDSPQDDPWREKFVATLASQQADDGSWKACGQLPLQRRPKIETTATTTLWTTYALIKNQQAGSPKFDRQKAIAFADQVSQAVSTEWWAARLLVAGQSGDPNVATFRRHLIDQQNDDGGWGWRLGEASDALGTGYALFALSATGTKAPSIAAAREFLLLSQTAAGHWVVPGTKKSAKGKSTATATDWGTAWAVIALNQSAPPSPANEN